MSTFYSYFKLIRTIENRKWPGNAEKSSEQDKRSYWHCQVLTIANLAVNLNKEAKS